MFMAHSLILGDPKAQPLRSPMCWGLREAVTMRRTALLIDDLRQRGVSSQTGALKDLLSLLLRPPNRPETTVRASKYSAAR
jgi:hypothetical protein